MERIDLITGTNGLHSVAVALSIFRIRVPPPTLQLPHIFTGIPSHLFSCLAALALAKDRPFQYLGTALRVSVFLKNFLVATWPLFTKSLMECSASRPFLYHCFLVASLSTPPDFHLRFFNLHAHRFLGVMCRTTLSKPRLTWLTGVNIIPRFLYGTYIHFQTPHNNAAHVDDTRSYRT